MVKLVMIVMKKNNLSSNGEAGHDWYEKKAYAVMVKLVTIAMKRKFKQ
jgi:hypothetical protein